jgi:UDP:flavonoid glycosyltransferase YjiC (YdhE family)
MRVLFSSVPATGHVAPLLALAAAARGAGHEVALVTAAEMASLAAPVPLLPAGPSGERMIEEANSRTGGDVAQPGPAAIEFFAGVRVERSFDQALEQARTFGPDLLVCESIDAVGPMLAAALDVPWVEHTIAGPLPAELAGALRERAGAEYRTRSLVPRPRTALLDIYPELLLGAAERSRVADRIPMQPGAHRGDGAPVDLPVPRPGRPTVLVTLGTSVQDPATLSALVSSVAAEDVTVLVTARPEDLRLDLAATGVQAIGFVPLADLLPLCDVVLGSAGTGTMLAALAAGKPQVLRPFLADQPWNAARAARVGAALVIEDPATAGAAVRRVLDDPRHREAAQAVAALIEQVSSPGQALAEVWARLGT